MKLTVLGKYGPFPAAGGACSGYLVEKENTKVLIECGSGVFSRLQQVCPINELSGIILSHLHSDHMSDIMILRYALDSWNAQGLSEDVPVPLYAPGNPVEEYNRLYYKNVYQITPIHAGMQLKFGELTFLFQEMTHPVQSFGMVISDGIKRIAYTGDTNYNDKIVPFVRDVNLFIADTGLLYKDKTGPGVPHLTALEAGIIASKAEVEKMMLSHIWPGYTEEEVVKEAAVNYPDAFIAREMEEYII